jgi:hypothetical protein
MGVSGEWLLPTRYPHSLPPCLLHIDPPPITGAKLPLAKEIKDFDFADLPWLSRHTTFPGVLALFPPPADMLWFGKGRR